MPRLRHVVAARADARSACLPRALRLSADPVDAEAIEQFVLKSVVAPAPGLVADAAPEELGSIFRRLFVAVRVGGCAQDFSIVWRL